MKKVFIKEHSREYSLFRIYALHENYCVFSPQLFDYEVKGVCLVYRGQELASAYYAKDSWKELLKHIGIKAQNKEFIEKEVNALLKYFDELMPYFLGRKNVKSIDELREIYNKYVQYYLRHGMIFAIPLISSLPEENKKIALNARKKVQEYGETIEIVFKKALQLLYPHLKSKVQFILPQEVWSGEADKPSIEEKISERQKGFVFYQGRLYAGENIEEILAKLGIVLSEGKEIKKEIKELKGQVAHKGKVRGMVKIVSSVKDLDNVKDKDILVAAMTMPKYLIAMKRAAAFVTDEGGITCHAAIVAREMKKHCVIGTKIATKVLKDGDEVEVDATKGLVKIIKKA